MNITKEIFFLRLAVYILGFVLVFIIASILIGKVLAAENTIILKKGDCSNLDAGWSCYNTAGQEELDRAIRTGIQNKLSLDKCLDENKALKQGIKWVTEQKTVPEPAKKFYQERWFQITASTLAAFGLGVGIGASF